MAPFSMGRCRLFDALYRSQKAYHRRLSLAFDMRSKGRWFRNMLCGAASGAVWSLLCAQELPAEGVARDLTGPYMTCMKETAVKYHGGGASMELALDTAHLKCSTALQPFYAELRQGQWTSAIGQSAAAGLRTAVREQGRVAALDALTSVPTQPPSQGRPR